MMNYKEILSRPRPMEPLCCHRDFVISEKSTTAMMKAAREHVRNMDKFNPTEFAVQVTFPCGHQQCVNLTKSAIKKRHWVSDIQRVIDHGCYRCYKVASDAVEAARKRFVKLVCEGQVASIREAVELVTGDAELRVAVYERVGRWRENPLAMNLADVTA